jgi:hypothetical protein
MNDGAVLVGDGHIAPFFCRMDRRRIGPNEGNCHE